jgi:hypothetical protein
MDKLHNGNKLEPEKNRKTEQNNTEFWDFISSNISQSSKCCETFLLNAEYYQSFELQLIPTLPKCVNMFKMYV